MVSNKSFISEEKVTTTPINKNIEIKLTTFVEGSLSNSYYTEMEGREPVLSQDHSTLL